MGLNFEFKKFMRNLICFYDFCCYLVENEMCFKLILINLIKIENFYILINIFKEDRMGMKYK